MAITLIGVAIVVAGAFLLLCVLVNDVIIQSTDVPTWAKRFSIIMLIACLMLALLLLECAYQFLVTLS